MKMKPEIKKMWVEALRSGDYQQGWRRMKYNDTFCCLGVLSELYCGIADKSIESLYEDVETGFLNHEVIEWSGLSNEVTVDVGGGELVHLEYVNDILWWDFNEIADLIEEQL